MWKKRKRSGGIRRRIEKEYLNIANNSHDSEKSLCEEENDVLNPTTYCQTPISSTSKEGSVAKNSNSNTNKNIYEKCVNFAKFSEPEDDDSSCSSSSSSNYDDNEFTKNLLFRQKIKEWATERNISQVALNDLAAIVNDRFPGILPYDARTILGTVKEVRIKTIEKGEYWHNGLINSLKKSLEKWNNVPSKITLNFNFDGLPIFKSSNKEFWPILCNIFERPDIEPFVIGIYFGVGKPNQIDQYLEDFVYEMEHLIKNGIYIEKVKNKIHIGIRCFICDSPARAYIKGVCNFNAKHGCLKCVTVGEYSHVSHTVTFPVTNCRSRTDQEFREKKYGPHHKKDSPLLRLPIDMIRDFPVADSLHLIDLGIMKRLLVGWRSGNFGKYITKWSFKDFETVSNFLTKCKLPSEIHRSVRGLDCLSHWKASEYRSFLLYLSIVILPEVLSHDAFFHFLAFFCGITICSSGSYSHFLPLAKELLQYFVEHYKDFYGADYITSNVHNLVHIADEVQHFGPLHTFNAYPFENKLYLIKRMLRHGNKPLAQVAKRFSEDSTSSKRTWSKENQQVTYREPFVTTNSRKLTILHFKDFKMSSRSPDKYFLCTNNDILEVKKIATDSSEIKICGYKITDLVEVFEKPVKSSYLYIFKANLQTNRRTEIIVSPQDIKIKLVCIGRKNQLYFIPLLHTV